VPRLSSKSAPIETEVVEGGSGNVRPLLLRNVFNAVGDTKRRVWRLYLYPCGRGRKIMVLAKLSHRFFR
jgi:hypothetical protein